MRQWQSQSINAPHIPEVRWNDIGGLEHVISELLDTIQLPLKFPELVQNGLKRSGWPHILSPLPPERERERDQEISCLSFGLG